MRRQYGAIAITVAANSRFVPCLQQLHRYYSTDAPTKVRGGSKVFDSADAAVADLKDGDVVLSAGFGLCGVAGTYLD